MVPVICCVIILHALKEAFAPGTWSNWTIGLTAGILAWRTLNAIKRQGDLAHATLVSTFRPKIVVRTINLIPDSTDGHTAGDWTITLRLMNTGGSPAHIRDSRIDFDWLRRSPDSLHHIQSAGVEEFSLAAGESKVVALTLQNEIQGGANLHIQLRLSENTVLQGGHRQMTFLSCSGSILYADDIGIKRTTGICRTYDIKTRSFVPSTSPEKEYVD